MKKDIKAPPSYDSLNYARRDRLICWIINQILKLASYKYRAMIKGSIRYGLIAAAKDEDESILNLGNERN